MLASEVMLAFGVKDKKTAEAWCKDHPAEMDQIAWDAGPGENIGEIATLWWDNASTKSSTVTEKRGDLKRKRGGEENGAMVKEPVKRPANSYMLFSSAAGDAVAAAFPTMSRNGRVGLMSHAWETRDCNKKAWKKLSEELIKIHRARNPDHEYYSKEKKGRKRSIDEVDGACPKHGVAGQKSDSDSQEPKRSRNDSCSTSISPTSSLIVTPDLPSTSSFAYISPNIDSFDFVNPNSVEPNIDYLNFTGTNFISPNSVDTKDFDRIFVDPRLIHPTIFQPNLGNPSIDHANISFPNPVNSSSSSLPTSIDYLEFLDLDYVGPNDDHPTVVRPDPHQSSIHHSIISHPEPVNHVDPVDQFLNLDDYQHNDNVESLATLVWPQTTDPLLDPVDQLIGLCDQSHNDYEEPLAPVDWPQTTDLLFDPSLLLVAELLSHCASPIMPSA